MSGEYTVYKHTTPSEKAYIGITSLPLHRRTYNAGSGYRRNPYFYKAIKKYGWENISHEISQETREKIRRKLKENPARHWQGKKFSEERRQKEK